MLEIVLSLMKKIDMIVTIMNFIDVTDRWRLIVVNDRETMNVSMNLLASV